MAGHFMRRRGKKLEDTKHFDSLDGLRSIFCIGIVIYHVNDVFNSAFSEWLDPIYQYGGYWGNYIFFIMSGFLIAYRYKEGIADRKCSFSSFMARRILPMYPIYFLSNLSMMLLKAPHITVKQTITTFLMVSTGWFSGTDTPYNLPAWFLCVLNLCYLLYFFLCVVSRNSPRSYLLLCCSLIIGGMLLEKGDWNIPFCYRTCGEAYMNFFLGVFSEYILIQKKKRLTVLNCTFFFVSAISIYIFGMRALPGDMRWWISGICANLICVAVCSRHAAKILLWRPLQIIGKSSRSIYLWHSPVANAFRSFTKRLRPVFPDPKVNFLLYFLVLFVFISLTQDYFEKAGKLLIKKYQNHIGTKEPPKNCGQSEDNGR